MHLGKFILFLSKAGLLHFSSAQATHPFSQANFREVQS